MGSKAGAETLRMAVKLAATLHKLILLYGALKICQAFLSLAVAADI